jgi:hypothetical protein
MPDQPSGTVTFLFTDLVDSTRLWDEFPVAMGAAPARDDEILHAAVAVNDGHIAQITLQGELWARPVSFGCGWVCTPRPATDSSSRAL